MPRPDGVRRSFPPRAPQPPTDTGRRDIRAAYARVAVAVGLSADEVRATWLAIKSRHTTPDVFDEAHHQAIVMLNMSEDTLDGRFRSLLAGANVYHPRLPDGSPRFLYYHTHRSDRSPAGFPDGVLLDRVLHRLYFWELKREEYEPPPAQQAWLSALGAVAAASAGTVVLLGIVRPSNMPVLRAALQLPD